ncbi:MAG: hypothetical protein KDD44_11605 [Bdellovibrionales bacterium]|nr:hypothetical protein [Bdellovibrionales bacterium]
MAYARIGCPLFCLALLLSFATAPQSAEAEQRVRTAHINGCDANSTHGGTLGSGHTIGGYVYFQCHYPAYFGAPVQLWLSISANSDGNSTYPNGATSDSCLEETTMTLVDSKIPHQQEDQVYWFAIPLDYFPVGVRFSIECARPQPEADGTTYYTHSNTRLGAVVGTEE